MKRLRLALTILAILVLTPPLLAFMAIGFVIGFVWLGIRAGYETSADFVHWMGDEMESDA